MTSQKQRGFLIAVEGIDGAGKTTQVRLLRDALAAAGLAVVTSKEPTDGEWGRRIRQSAAEGRLDLEAELELFVRDRTEHGLQLVRPALEQGKVVILDRYYYSTIAYQGSRGADFREIQRRMESLFVVPDLVILLDLAPEISLRRIREGRGETPNEFEKAESLSKARAVFNALEEERIERIDGTLPVEAVHERIMARVQRMLGVTAPGHAPA